MLGLDVESVVGLWGDVVFFLAVARQLEGQLLQTTGEVVLLAVYLLSLYKRSDEVFGEPGDLLLCAILEVKVAVRSR